MLNESVFSNFTVWNNLISIDIKLLDTAYITIFKFKPTQWREKRWFSLAQKFEGVKESNILSRKNSDVKINDNGYVGS